MRESLVFFVCAWAAASADVTGKWNMTAITPSGREMKLEMEIKGEPGKLAGVLVGPQGSVTLEEVTLNGDELLYKIPVEGSAYRIKFAVTGDRMKGTWTSPDGNTGPVSAARAAAAASAGGVLGQWKVQARSASGQEHRLELAVSEEAGKLAAKLIASDGEVITLQDVRLEGSEFSFKVPVSEGTYSVKMTVTEGAMKGTYSGPESGTVTATR